ncbi:hypothetical protein BASA50_008015 [Batrachochytrium salamandrivorans]|uniref:EF-hand domain-containing protein n=1 Tax=Batrachochytrium salamandrivorans TaxID=1357716 RepID=A0ABQ8F5F0_9FUNG|nr:hypothetical protein BASA62_005333 [Batrachochytrium salamandrivorans]KAH6572594.1 hypothetical protein BASA60_006563 [Batrachochytrium salamandrivorans]KAH6592564.1 hypothetical protein BASA50_008015 [Batrachochytrium salamandrivorans]KAH6598340.1 hypothetical protein BASA61_002895 [Batrachochytrium salamandrivorans]KAH9273402.1 hypothetical protein BASA83_004406 [Batrachochytrium salamandrivorans]
MFMKAAVTSPGLGMLLAILAFYAMLPCTSIANLSEKYGESTNYGDVSPSAAHFSERLRAAGYGQDIPTESSTHNQDVIYFFSIHDYNYDGKLDGHELRLAFQGFERDTGKESVPKIDMADLETMIDHALIEDDTDNDGMISWEEYLESQSYHHKLDVEPK